MVAISTHILHNMKGFLGRHKDLSDSYKPCLFISYLQVYLHILMALTSFPESHNYHHSEIDVLMVRLKRKARVVGLSCDSSVIDKRIRKH